MKLQVESGLTSLEIAEGVKLIGPQAFEYCSSLQSVSIPSTAASIGDSAFASCASLASVTISEGVREIGASAFASCEKLDSLTAPSSLTNIADRAFEDCVSLTSVTLANGVKSIGSDAFFRCEELEEIQIPTSVTYIGEDAFAWCEKLATIYVEKGDADRVRGLLSASGFDASLVEFVEIVQEIKPDGEYTEKVGDYTWYFVVRGGMATIRCWPGKSAATDPSPRGELVIPDTLGGCPVVGIGYGAFGSCNGIESVVIPESVTSIELCAFMWCSGIRRITVKSHSPVMGYFTFGGCDSLRDVYFYGDMPIFGEETFPNEGVVIHVQNGAQGWDNAIHGMDVRFEELTDTPPPRPEAKQYFVSESGSDEADGITASTPLRTIQKAVDLAKTGDTVVVSPGDYESFVCEGKVIRIVSTDGPGWTIIDGGWTNRCATIDVGYVSRLYYQMNWDAPNAWVCNRTTELSGFTLTGGDVSDTTLYGYNAEGGGAFGGVLTNCVVYDCCTYSGSGGGGCCGSVLRDCEVSDCYAFRGGGGVRNCHLDRCEVYGNWTDDNAGGVCESRADNCLISGNHSAYVGGGAYMSVLRNCTVVDNLVTYSQGAGVADCEVVNSIIWNNRMLNGEAIDNWRLFNAARPAMTYTCTTPLVPGVGNIDADPCLVQDRLAVGSPCIGAGCEIPDLGDRDCAGDARKQGARVNLGAYETVETGCVVRVSVTRGCGTVWCEGIKSSGGSLPAVLTLGTAINVNKGSEVRIEAFPGIVDLRSGAVRVESDRKFLGFYIDGVRVEDSRVSDVGYSVVGSGGLHGKVFTVVANEGVLSVEAKFEEVAWHVSTAGNDNNDGLGWATAKRSIQAAVDVALPKDLIEVASGVYEPVQEKKGYDILIRGIDGPASTIIDGRGAAGCVSMSYVGAMISGFTLQNGFADHGGGIYGGGASNCVVRNNYSKYGGGGAYEAQLTDCVVEDNTSSDGYGGGVYRGSATRCIVRRNSSSSHGGGLFFSYALNSLIAGNDGGTGGGAYGSELVNCTVVSNNASCGGGVYGYDGEESICRNCIVWENYSGEWLDNGWAKYENSLTEPECEGAISADPQFVDAGNGDYRLQPTSPCVDAGNTAYAYGPVDLAGNARVVNGIVDIGAYEANGVRGDGYYTEKVGDYTWYFGVENGEAVIVNWHDVYAPAVEPVPERLIVPSALGGCPVIGIATGSLSDRNEIVSVVIPEGVREIDDWAFSGCENLEYVLLPSTLRSIGYSAFCQCFSLAYVDMKEGLEEIGADAFNECVSLQSVSIPSSVVLVGSEAFAFSGLMSVDIPSGLAEIGDYAFVECERLSFVTLPEGVETIGAGAFAGCVNLSAVVFPQSLTNIADNAFAWCAQLASLYFKGSQPTIAAYTFPNEYPTCYVRPENVWWNLDESSHWHGLRVVKSLPDGCHEEKVGDYTWAFKIENGEAIICRGRGPGPCGPDDFGYGPAVTPNPVGALEIPSRLGGCPVVGIGERTLTNVNGGHVDCSGLTSVIIHEGVRSIGECAFDSCSALMSVSFPDSLRVIESRAFQGCRNLKNVVLNDGLESIRDYAFWVTGLESVVVPDSVRSVGECAFGGGWLKNIEFGVGTTSIGVGVVYAQGELERIVVADGNPSYLSENGGLYTKDRCELLAQVATCQELVLPRALERIWQEAIQESMPNLDSIFVQEGNTNFVVSNALLVDRRINEVVCGPRTVGGTLVVPEGVVSVCAWALAESEYEEVVFPSTLKRIGEGAFFECEELSDVSLPEGLEEIGDHAFGSCLSLDDIDLPASVVKVGAGTFEDTGWWNKRICDPDSEETVFPGWMVLDGWVVGGCFDENLEEIVFDEGVKGLAKGVPSWTFGDIYAVQLPSTLRYIGDEAFYGCLQHDTLELPEGVVRIGDYAFGSNLNLFEVTLPASVESIGDYVFGWCDSLHTVNMMGNAPSVGFEPFYGSWGTVTLNVLPGTTGWDLDGSGELPMTWPANCECPAFLYCFQTPRPQIVEVVNPSGSGRVVEILSDPESVVFYTIDGSDPLENGMIYCGPIYVDSSMTIRAIARIEGIPDSNVAVKEIDAGTMPDVFDCAAFIPAGSWQKDGTSIKSVSPGSAGHSIMKMRVGGRWAMSFKWRSSTDGGFDIGTFSVNGKRVAQISGENGWTRVLCYLDGNDGWDVNTLVWDYHKDGSVDGGEDSIWISEIKFWEQPVVRDVGQAPLDAFGMDSVWSVTDQGAAVDGNKWNAQTAASSPYGLWMFVEGPVDLSFDWSAPSTVSSDALRLYVDNVDVNSIGDVEELQNCVYSLAKTGVHSIEWRYENENDESSGAWVKNVVLGECSEPAWNYTINTWEVDGVEFGEVSLVGVYGPCGQTPCVIPEPVGRLVVPETIDGWPVATIEADAFAGCYRMSSIALPASLWSVDQYAFEGCLSLTNISVYGDAEDQCFVSIDGVLYEQRHNDYLWQTGEEGDHLYLSVFPEGMHPMSFDFPEGVVDATFWPENLRQVYQLGLPSTFVGFVYGVDGNASFGGWSNLTRIDVADGNPLYYSDDGALYSYRKMYYGMADVPVRLIFWPRNKQPVSLLDTVEEIEQGAFANSDQIEEIALPAGITEISAKSFTGCSSLKRVTMPECNKVWKSVGGVLYSKRFCICPPGYEGELVIPEGEAMQYFDFDHVTKLTGVVFPASCTNVQSGCVFNTCPALRTIEFAGLPPEGIRWENFVSGSGVDRTKITIRYPSELADGWVSAANELEQLGFVVETSEPPVLTLAPLASSVAENSRSGVSVRLSRTGSTRKSLTVDVSAILLVGTELEMPKSVEIPAGSSSTIFTVKPVDDYWVEGDRVAVVQASAGGAEGCSCEIKIIDDEVPSLSLAISADTLKEGGAEIIVTVTRDLVTDEPLTVYLTGTTANRCSCPKSVSIPAGAASVTFEIEAANDDVARIAAEMTLRASAAGYGSASKTFTVEDDDIPGVTLTLTPDAAQEGGSVRATVARVDEDDLSKAITVKLSASVPQEIASMPSSVTIPAGKVSVDFNVYLADDGRDNGDRDVVLQGAILIESCGCSGQPSSGDAIEAGLTIIDNDGPALSLSVSPATMREGLDEAGFLTISHNSVLDEDLTVCISYDLDSEIEVAEQVIIKAGQQSVTVPVKTLNDGVEDGSKLVTIAVEDVAGVFAPDTKWLMVTDQNLPDFSANVNGCVSLVEANGVFDCQLTILNQGFADCGRAIPYAIYLLPESERDVTKGVLLSSGSIEGGLAQGALEVRTVKDVKAPASVGHYKLALVVDPNATITELDEANNTAWSNEFYVGPAYSARASVDGELFGRGAQVVVSGSATRIGGEEPAANVDVDVYVVCDGIRTTMRTKTDAAGQFTVTYQPTSGVCGHCIVGACYPGEGLEDEQDSFDILGLKAATTSALVWDIALGDENTKMLSVRNPTGVELTGFAIGNGNLPKGCELTLSAPAKLDAGDSQTFRITAKGTDLTDGVDYEPFEIVLTTAEGATLTHKAYFHCQSQKAYLRARPTSIDTTMTIGKVRTVEVEIYNDGKGDSGAVSVNFKCPDWLRIIGGNIGNLASNESAVLTFELAPTLAHGLNLNAVYSGTVGINCANGTGLALPVKFTPVTEEFGSVKVDAIDDNTYHLEGKPHLANAVVKVTNPYTQKIVATGRTDENGLWSAADLPEGKYQLTVTANNHDAYADELLIEPGRTTSVTAFLQYQSVRVSWDVTEVEITDEYDVELNLVYETNVPQPTVLTHVDTGLPNKKELPVLEEGQQRMFTITLENVGLIAAKRVTLTMPTIEGYTFTLADNDMMVPAKSSVEIPVLFARPAKRKMLMSNALKSQQAIVQYVDCEYDVVTTPYWDCNGERHYSYSTRLKHGTGNCKKVTYVVDPQPPTEYVPTRGGGSGGSYGGGGIGGGTGTTWKKTSCRPCDTLIANAKIELVGVMGNALQTGFETIRDSAVVPVLEELAKKYLNVIPLVSCVDFVVNLFSGMDWYGNAVNEIQNSNFITRNHFRSYASRGFWSGLWHGALDLIGCASGGASNLLFDGVKALTAIGDNLVAQGENYKDAIDIVKRIQTDYPECAEKYGDAIRDFTVASGVLDAETDILKTLFGDYFDKIELEDALKFYQTFVSVIGDDWQVAPEKVDQIISGIPVGMDENTARGILERINEGSWKWMSGSDEVDDTDTSAFNPGRMLKDFIEIDIGNEYLRRRGYGSVKETLILTIGTILSFDEDSDSVCASVTLKINQTVAMTRTAFDGTLTLFNGHSSVPITGVKFEPSVLNENGDECKDLFKLLLGEEEVVGVNGSKLITGADIAAGGSGSTVVRFVPTHEAAPSEAKVYRFGGVVTYTDPFTGQKATVELTPVSLTVEPSPYLKLDYFVQRDVFSDDPDTDEIEPGVPAEIAVLVRNVGAGEAKNVTIDSAQPVMTENEKGLAIDFKLSDFDLEGSCIDGKEAHLGLLSTVNFGTIESGESKIAQWWLTSSLQGHFVDMKATCTPRNKWNTPDTSLVDTEHIDVHKLVRSVSVDGDDLPDFLVCDEKDLYGLPDLVITTKGVPLAVRRDGKMTIFGTIAGASSDLLVAVTGSEGWNYVYLPIVGVSGYEVAGVSCDGAELPARNVWTTDRTFRDAGNPVVEDRLHLLVYFSEAGTKDILVHLNGTAANGPKVESFEGVTAGAMEYDVRNALTVVFDSAIDPATFCAADLQLIRQGAYVSDLSGVAIRATDGSNRSFELSGLAAYCSEKGRYELIVQCAGIRSADGLPGSVGKSVSWMLGASGAADSFVVTREVGVAGNVFTFTFSNPSLKLTKEHLKLMKNGAAVGVPPTVSIVDKGLGVYEVMGLDKILAEEGAYSLSCDLCGGVAASWSDDLTPPVAAANLRISPDGGIDEDDGITYTRELTVTGDLSEDGLTVEVLVSYAGAEPTKLADAIVKGRTFSACLVLPADGNATLVVRSTDAAGNSSDVTKEVYVDVIPFTSEFTGAPAEDVIADRIDLVFSDEIFEGDLELGHFSLTRDGISVSLSDALFAGADKSHFFVERLESICGEDGTYTLMLNAPAVRKRLSGLTLPVRTSVTWTYKCPDREPPTAGEVSIDGAAVESSYDLAFGRIEIPFSEAVNVPELIANGLITVAVRTDFAYLPSWNAANNVLTLTVLDEKLPRGAGRVVLDPALIKDMAGNELNCGQSEDLVGTDRYGEGLQLAKVDGYAMPTWHDGQLTVGYKTSAGAGIAKTGDQILVSGITGSGCQGVSVCWADWDGDGTEELVVGEANGRVTMRKGTTTTEIRSGSEATYGSTRAVLCSFDADGDGTSESVVCGGTDGKFRRLWKQEDGSAGCEWIADSQGLPIAVAEGRSAPVFADVNHDGRIDLLTGDAKGNVWLYYGTDRAWISAPVCLIDNSKGRLSDRSRVAYGDVNADGLGDLIVGRSDGSVVALLGERRPAPAITYEIVWPITLGESVNAAQLAWEVGGASFWTPEWWDDADDGEHCAFIRNVGNNTNAWMWTTVDGPGEITFAWMCDLTSRNTRLQFFVDDVAQGVVSGLTPWTPVSVSVYGEGAHTLKWRLFTGRSGAAETDVGAVDAVAWTPAVPPTLAEALNSNLEWRTEGVVVWHGVAKDAKLATRDAWAVVTGLGDEAVSAVETQVYGNGLLMFDWAVSCEEEYDWLEVSVDGNVYTYITGDVDWLTDGVEIEGEGWHTVRWSYCKDEMDDPEMIGDNIAMLDNVVWLSEDVPPEEPQEPEKTATENTPVPVPYSIFESASFKVYLDAASGDYESAAMAIGKNGCPIWGSFVAGLDPERPDSKFTAKIEIVNGKPVVTWEPALNGTNDDGTCIKEGVRVYELKGSINLKDWSTVPKDGEAAFNFFKVEVKLPVP